MTTPARVLTQTILRLHRPSRRDLRELAVLLATLLTLMIAARAAGWWLVGVHLDLELTWIAMMVALLMAGYPRWRRRVIDHQQIGRQDAG